MSASLAWIACLVLGADPVAGEPGPEVLQEYRAAAQDAGRDPDAHVRLALWCESHGLEAERLRHLARAVMADPANALARSLLGLVEYRGKWARPEEVADRVKADDELAEKLAEYNARRERMKPTADSHWRLAVWCEEQGLADEARAHFTAVTRLDPGRAAAWKRLGCKKVNGRWMTEAQIEATKAEHTEQAAADAKWGPKISRWKAHLDDRDPRHREEAEAGLAGITDPRAVPAMLRAFGTGMPSDQARLVRLLGQVDAPAASRGLALLSLVGATDEIRRAATETLSRCDPHDYMGSLITLLRNRYRYEVRPVGGPGSPGALFVEGQRFNRMLVYAPPAPSFPIVSTGQSWATDDWGYEILRIPGANYSVAQAPQKVATFTGAEYRQGVAAGDPRAAAYNGAIAAGSSNSPWQVATHLFKPGWGTAASVKDSDFTVNVTRQTTDTFATETVIPIGRLVEQYRMSAAMAQEQLKSDVAVVEAENTRIDSANAVVLNVLNNVSGRNFPADPETWRAWWTDQLGYAYVPVPPAPRPTVVQNVPLAYVPQGVPVVNRIGPKIASQDSYEANSRLTQEGLLRFRGMGLFPCCFGAGTLVRTIDGTKPIEDVDVGDRVLSQDERTGALRYQPVLATFRFRPSATIRLELEDGPVVCTPLHRFWEAGRGWTMARDLKPGDFVRTIGSVSRVVTVESGEPVQPVYNLEVAEDASFFVGAAGVLSHDNTASGRRSRPFDLAAIRP